MKVSIKTKFMVIIVFTLILAVSFTYGITLITVYRNIEMRFDREIEQKRKLFLYSLDDLSMQVQRESKIISENIFLKNYLKGEYFKDIENRPVYTENNILNFLWEKYDYEKLINELKKNVKENFRVDTEIEIQIINKYGIKIIDDKKDINFGREFTYEFTSKMLEERLEYFYEKKGLYIKGYSPIYTEETKEFIGGIYVILKINKNFINYFRNSFDSEIFIYDNNDNYIISTFEKPSEIEEIIQKIDIKYIKEQFLMYEIDKKPYKISKFEIFSKDGKKVGSVLIGFSKTDIIQNLRQMSIYLFIFLFVFFSIIAIVSTAVMETIVMSIKNLTIKINGIREGNFNVSLGNLVKRNDEIGILAKDFEDVVDILKNKIEQLERASKSNIEYSDKLKKVNAQLESTQREMLEKNNNIFNINKNLKRRITEISNLYHMIINIAKYIVDEKFYTIVVKAIREGLSIKKVIYYEKNNEGVLVVKSRIGAEVPENSKIILNDEFIKILLDNEIYRVTDEKYFKWKDFLMMPYIMPLLSTKTGNVNEVYGVLVFDNEKEMYIDIINAVITYVKTIVLAYENRNLYLKIMLENKKLEETMKKLKESEKMKNIFLANVSHELKVPLVPIKGYTEIMLNGTLGNINVSQRKVLITMLNNSERLQTIIENILNYSRIESGKYQFINAKYNLVTFINSAIEHLENTIEKSRIRIIKDFSEYNSDAYGDGDAIKQVIINILSNSIKFSSEYSKVKITIKDDKNKYKVFIEDEGIGMERSKIDKIFESFRQIEEGDTRKYGGIGLGLTIAQKILDYYGEKLNIVSRINEGTVISFYINKAIQ